MPHVAQNSAVVLSVCTVKPHPPPYTHPHPNPHRAAECVECIRTPDLCWSSALINNRCVPIMHSATGARVHTREQPHVSLHALKTSRTPRTRVNTLPKKEGRERESGRFHFCCFSAACQNYLFGSKARREERGEWASEGGRKPWRTPADQGGQRDFLPTPVGRPARHAIDLNPYNGRRYAR